MSTPTGGQPPQGPWDPRDPQGPQNPQQGPPQGPPPWAGQVARGQGPVGPQGAPRPPQSGFARLLIPIALVVAALSVVGLFLISQGSSTEVGDCVARGADDGIETVSCDSADADYRVASVLEGYLSTEAQDACLRAVPESTASYFEGSTGERGTVLCLTGV
ncbi:hypothetical protein F1C76_01700 [Geodermatophilaceae bacterium NBWT11]|nr:hypothetical protein F1C76_01700 [Geodermatophilaceae bacterium NBWT11]